MAKEVNREIKLEILGAGLKFWEVAHELGVSSSTFSVRLRRELSEKEKASIRSIISMLTERCD